MGPLGDWVVAAGMEGMTSKYPKKTKPGAAKEPVANDGFFGEVGAGRFEAAGRSKERGNDRPIEEKEAAHDARDQFMDETRSTR